HYRSKEQNQFFSKWSNLTDTFAEDEKIRAEIASPYDFRSLKNHVFRGDVYCEVVKSVNISDE
ncbi:hypothetical protein PFISCL1PPCAC_14451, partial [Pristionchus fissidentatus]